MPKLAHLLIPMFLLCSIALYAAAPNNSDTVLFKDGDKISGQLIRADSESVQLRSQTLGELTIRWPDILEVRSRNRVWKVDAQGSAKFPSVEFVNAVLRSTDSVLTVETDSRLNQIPEGRSVLFVDQEHPAAGLTQIMGVKAPAAPPDSSVAVSLNAPESVVLGTQSQEVFGGSFRLLHNEPDLCAAPSWFSALLLAANHNKTYKIKAIANVTDTYDGTVSLTNSLSQKARVAGYVVADLFGNSSLGIGLQQSYGAGVTEVLFSNGCHGSTPVLPEHFRFTANGDASLRYIHQRLYAPGTPQDLAGLRIGENLVYVALGKDKDGTQKERFTIDQSLWVIPMLNDSRAVEAGGSLGISLPLGKSLSVGITEEDDFFNDAPKAKRKNYTKSAVTITYTFPAPPK